jgi:hypothetical protein
MALYREPAADPAQSKNLCMYGISMRENRDTPWSSVEDDEAADRFGKSKDVSRRCTTMGSQMVP